MTGIGKTKSRRAVNKELLVRIAALPAELHCMIYRIASANDTLFIPSKYQRSYLEQRNYLEADTEQSLSCLRDGVCHVVFDIRNRDDAPLMDPRCWLTQCLPPTYCLANVRKLAINGTFAQPPEDSPASFREAHGWRVILRDALTHLIGSMKHHEECDLKYPITSLTPFFPLYLEEIWEFEKVTVKLQRAPDYYGAEESPKWKKDLSRAISVLKSLAWGGEAVYSKREVDDGVVVSWTHRRRQ